MGTIYLSETANPLLISYLKAQGHLVQLIRSTRRTYEPVSSHPDIYFCSPGPGHRLFRGQPDRIGYSYPQNIIYNAACIGKYFIHNLKYTDPELLRCVRDMRKIHVSQGYTKCNTVVVDEHSIITSDQGIFKACRDHMDVLLIRPHHVKLSGFPYGFLGGASGRVENTLLFHGNLKAHPDFGLITDFIRSRGLKLVYFEEFELEDIGSILWES